MRRVLFISYDFPIGVLFIDDWSIHFYSKKKRQKKNKTKKNENKKTKQNKTKEKKKCKDMFVSHILLHRFFVVGFISGGLSEIFFMRDELRESSLRSFVPWIMTDMYMILIY